MKLATRIIILVAAITLLMGIFTVILSGPIIKYGFDEMDHEWIESLTASLAEGIAHDTINGNATRARQILEAVVLKNKELDYAYIVDFEGHVFTHSFKNGFPEKLVKLIRGENGEVDVENNIESSIHSKSFFLDGTSINDISHPIIEGMSARLHLGLNEARDDALIKNIDQKLFLITFVLVVVGILIALPISRQLTKPLDQFGRLMQNYGRGKIKGEFDLPEGSAEVNKLGEAFKKMIVELEENQNLFAAMFESLSDAVIVANTEHCMTIVNTATKNLFGYDEQDLLGMATSILYAHPKGFSQTGKQRYNVDAKGDPLPYEVECRRKDGSVFIGETLCTQITSKDGVLFGFVGVIRDVTERKQAERAMFLNELRLNDAQRIAKVGSWELDLLTGKLVWSDEIFRMFEIDKLKFSASYDAFLNAIHPGDRDLVNEAYSNSLEMRQPYEIVHRLQMSDGTIKHVRETCESYFDDENKPIRSVGAVQDITEIVVAEIELIKHQEHLEELVDERTKELHNAQDELIRKERLATLGQLTATVSHELRNPLGAMRPSLYVIEKKSDKEDERVQNAIARIDRNINRCDRIIDELLDFTRITDLHTQLIQIDEWLESVIAEQIIPEGIQIEKDFSLKGVNLSVDTDRLRRAIINVCENSCHAMMDESQQVVMDKDARLKIKTAISNERVEIIITDTGSGISEEVLEKIYEPLFSTKGFGVGLGMPTVKQIMEQHFGGIEIQSEEGKGTTVRLWLPKTTEEMNRGKENE
jgi:PAS domain S-box-containing protein